MGRGVAIDWEGRELLVGERENWWAKGRISKPEGGMVGEREDRWTTGKTGGREGQLVGEREDGWEREDWWARGRTGGRRGVGKDENRRGVEIACRALLFCRCWALPLFPKWIFSQNLGLVLAGYALKRCICKILGLFTRPHCCRATHPAILSFSLRCLHSLPLPPIPNFPR